MPESNVLKGYRQRIDLCRRRVLRLERAIDAYEIARNASEMSNEQAAYEHLIRVKNER